MTDGVLGNLKEPNGRRPRVLEVELTASLNCRVRELDSNEEEERERGGSGQGVGARRTARRLHCTDERRESRAKLKRTDGGVDGGNGQGMKITPCNRSGDGREGRRRNRKQGGYRCLQSSTPLCLVM